uniref:Uncharacterized protein n=1 Tax=Plectus sambesii TaxID=2011161 RepID=A0A914VCY3_9BILA
MGHSAEVVADFADHTTAHGFGNVLRCDSCSGKGVWIVAMLIAWTVCCIQLAVTIIAYLQYPTATTIAVQYSSSVQFPAVTVCNLNAARWSKMLNDSTLANYTNLLRAARPQTRSWNEYAPGTGRSSLFNQDSINEETAYKLLYIQAIYERNVWFSNS